MPGLRIVRFPVRVVCIVGMRQHLLTSQIVLRRDGWGSRRVPGLRIVRFPVCDVCIVDMCRELYCHRRRKGAC